ncbi:ATP-binding protein [Lutibacter sp.]|uniref:tetratricopeptide repeat-containing sensor histidine kinase n=1 Tax=Lutibacter sp. TaxID=1925666 RepID=UPI00356B2F4D
MRNDTLAFETRLQSADKALQWVNSTKDSSATKDILAHKIYFFGNLMQFDSAINTSKELLQLSMSENDSAAIGNNYFRLAYYYNQNFKKDSAFLCYKLSKEIHLQLGDSSKAGENLAEMAIIQSDLGDFVGSDDTGIQALKYLDENNFQYLTAVYNCIAISAIGQKNYNEAIYWYDKAINISIKNTDKISYLQNKANAYRYLKIYDKSITILDSLSKVDLNNHKSRATIIDNLAYTKWLAKKEENVLPELERALEIRLQENNLWGLIASYAHLSTYYESVNSKMALSYASKMYDVAIRQNSTPDQLEALQKMIELENPEKAKQYYGTYLRLNDSLQNSKQISKNQFAKIKYDSDKNREENAQLKFSTAEKQLEIQKGKTNNILLFTSGSTIFISLLFFMYYKRKKHQIEKRVEVYKTEERIAKKIHDEVANNMVNIMNKVQYTENPKAELLDDLEKVYLLTRDISHQNNAIETGAQFEPFLKSMLTSFNNNTTTVILKDLHKVELSVMAIEKQIELYRVLQELMVNMRKHSEATLVAIAFKDNKNILNINYSDNGKGLDLIDLKFKNGLKNVETRINSINGTITFDSTKQNGFKAFISFKK